MAASFGRNRCTWVFLYVAASIVTALVAFVIFGDGYKIGTVVNQYLKSIRPPSPLFWDIELVPWTAEMRKNYRTIYNEVRSLSFQFVFTIASLRCLLSRIRIVLFSRRCCDIFFLYFLDAVVTSSFFIFSTLL